MRRAVILSTEWLDKGNVSFLLYVVWAIESGDFPVDFPSERVPLATACFRVKKKLGNGTNDFRLLSSQYRRHKTAEPA